MKLHLRQGARIHQLAGSVGTETSDRLFDIVSVVVAVEVERQLGYGIGPAWRSRWS